MAQKGDLVVKKIEFRHHTTGNGLTIVNYAVYTQTDHEQFDMQYVSRYYYQDCKNGNHYHKTC